MTREELLEASCHVMFALVQPGNIGLHMFSPLHIWSCIWLVVWCFTTRLVIWPFGHLAVLCAIMHATG